MKRQREGAHGLARDAALMAEAAAGRAKMYDLFFDVFTCLPDGELLSEIKAGRFDALLSIFGDLGGQRLHDGCALVASYQSYLLAQDPTEALNELSVDRTRLVRGIGDRGPRPPYERLYTIGSDTESGALARVKGFFRKAGLVPDEGACEPPDFLFVELDFMKQLCLAEIRQWSEAGSAEESRALQRQFLRQHVGRWAGAYLAEAEKWAHTDFYRGFLALLDGFLAAERAYLEGEARE